MNNFIEYPSLRGQILEYLYIHFLQWIEDDSLCDILQKAKYNVSLPQVQGHLRYLAEKGYVELSEAGIAQLTVRNLVKITPKGVFFIEGSIPPDAGIERNESSAYAMWPRIRGYILKYLFINLPEFTDDELVTGILNDSGYMVNQAQVYSQFCLMADPKILFQNDDILDPKEGLVTIKEVSVNELGLSRRMAKITSHGVDLLEGRELPVVSGVERV